MSKYRIELFQEQDGSCYWLLWEDDSRSVLSSPQSTRRSGVNLVKETHLLRILRTKQEAEGVLDDLERINRK